METWGQTGRFRIILPEGCGRVRAPVIRRWETFRLSPVSPRSENLRPLVENNTVASTGLLAKTSIHRTGQLKESLEYDRARPQT